jgi:formylglycine-generating enzyme required for sulfatase activity
MKRRSFFISTYLLLARDDRLLAHFARLNLAAPGQPSRTGAFAGARAGDHREISGVKLCWCPPGRFRMGSPPSEADRHSNEGPVEVVLSRGFWMGKYGVTQGLWNRVVGSFPAPLDAGFEGRGIPGVGEDFPIYNINHAEAEAFCHALTRQSRASGVLPGDWEIRLPTEAQWEYACRAGTTTATAFGDRLSSRQANFKGDSPYNGAASGPFLQRPERVGHYPANGWGLYDMPGNLDEWCRDWAHDQLPGGKDPDPPYQQSRSRVRRGGCWLDPGWACRSASRRFFEPERRAPHIGFRIVAVQRVTIGSRQRAA